MKKVLCLVLSALMLTLTLAACSEPPIEDTEGGSETVTDVIETVTDAPTNENGETEQIADIPEDVDYDGMEIGIAVRPQTQYRREFGSEVQSDPVDQRIFKRNEEVEKELGIKLKIMGVDQLWTIEGITEYVTTEYQSGVNSAVDVIAAYGAYGVTSGLRGYYINLLDDDMTYLNTEKLYWNQSYVRAATCFGQLYYIVGDVNLTIYDKSIVTFVNMDLAATNGIAPETLYDAVDNKEWTYDYFYNICNGFTYLDTGNTENVVDTGDVIPLSSIGAEFVEGIPCAWELEFMVTHENGSHSFNIDGNAKLEQALSMWSEIHSMHGVFVTSTVGESFTNNFIPGNGLFSIDILYRNADSNAMLRNADFTYAILPLPMYDTNQDGYYTTPQDAYNVMSVMRHHPDKLEAVSAALELLSEKSYEKVRPFYIEKMVKATYISGANQVRMLELAMSGSSFQTVNIYGYQLYRTSQRLFHSLVGTGTSVAEKWAEIRSTSESDIQDFDAWFQASM